MTAKKKAPLFVEDVLTAPAEVRKESLDEAVGRLARDLIKACGSGIHPGIAVQAFAGEVDKLDEEHRQAILALLPTEPVEE